MEKKKLYISDLDGTLLNKNSEISDFSKQELNRLIAEGVKFSVASARGANSIAEAIEGINLELPVIECNGAYVTDLKTGKHLIINEIPTEVSEGILNVFDAYGSVPYVSCHINEEDKLYHGKSMNTGMMNFHRDKQKANDPRLQELDVIGEALKGQIVSFNYVDKREVLEEINEALKVFEQHINSIIVEDHCYEGWYWLMINSVHATKETGIKVLMEDLEMSSYKLTVFGDNLNDLEMFELADEGVAVGNAHERLKSRATEIIGSNDEDSVVRYILRNH